MIRITVEFSTGLLFDKLLLDFWLYMRYNVIKDRNRINHITNIRMATVRKNKFIIKYINPCFSKVNKNFPALGYTIAAFLMLIPLTFIAVRSWAVNERRVPIEIKDGYFDLRGQDFEHYYFEAYGDEFYPSQYLAPSEIDSAKSEVNDRTADYGTVHMTLILPDNGAYVFNFRAFAYAWRIYVNGNIELTVGNPGTTLAETEPSATTRRELITVPKDGVIDLVFHLANFHHVEKGVGGVVVHVAKPGFIAQYGKFDLGEPYRIAVVGALFSMALLLFSVWLTNIRRIQNLWFALTVLVMAFRQCVVSDIGYAFLPFLSDAFIIRIEYISLPLITVFMFMYMNKVFPGLFHRLFEWYVYFGTLSYFMIALFTANEFFTWCLRFWYVFFISLLVYALARFIWKYRKPKSDQAVAVAGFIVLVIASLNDVFIYNAVTFLFGWINMTEPAMLVMVLTQVVALFLANARITAEAREAERMLTEENIMLDKLNRMKTEFLGNMSHELKTPLTCVTGFAKHSFNVMNDESFGYDRLDVIRNNLCLIAVESDRMKRIVEQLLDIAAIEQDKFILNKKYISIAELTEEVSGTRFKILNTNGNTLKIDISTSLPEIYADYDRLTQVLTNLLSNAARHTRGGVIKISACMENEYMKLSVSDNGEGIPKELQDKLFERYLGADVGRAHGTGLGLYICKQIIEAHDGEIHIESEPGLGTAVYFTLPLERGKSHGKCE